MYSVVSASVLAIDLARHPSGAAVADAVDRVLSLDALPLAVPAPEEVRQRVRLACAGEQRATSALYGVTRGLASGLPTVEETRALATALSASLVGTLDDLLDLLREEEPVRGADAASAQVALDAVTVAWAGRSADLNDLAVLRAPWTGCVPVVPEPLPEREWSGALRDLLDEVPHRTDAQWERCLGAHRDRTRPRWSGLVHEACRAAHDAGRVRDVARAQLAAARVLRLSRASVSSDPQALAMVVTGAVQAVCTADLLDTSALLRSWEAGA